ncbi:MAG: four-carbon acid sugar kinase family protein [Chloroflexi bacterium]|nr:four-carbon acid sugar kinase family protein [Chloroflexota bacterium]
MLAPLAILADDLTGATDTGLQFAKQGQRTVVLFDEFTSRLAEEADIVVVDTDSRAAAPAIAYERVRRVAEAVRRAGLACAYKKIDSTARGNLGAEIDAALDAGLARGALVAPAFPATGRTVRDGWLYVRGRPLAETEYAHDPIRPVRDSRLPVILAGQTSRLVEVLALADLRRAPDRLAGELDRRRRRGIEIIVGDCETDDDLRILAGAAALEHEPHSRWLAVGSAGLAAQLAILRAAALSTPAAVPEPGPTRGEGEPVPLAPCAAVPEPGPTRGEGEDVRRHRTPTVRGAADGPILVVVGSLNPVGQQQVEVLRAQRNSAVVSFGLGRWLVDPSRHLGDLANELRRCWHESGVILLAVRHDQRDVLDALTNADRATVTRRLVDDLASVVVSAGHDRPLAGLVVTGGDTARALCRAFAAGSIRVLEEVAPGVPACQLDQGTRHGLAVVTKAGGFGTTHTLVAAVDYLRR